MWTIYYTKQAVKDIDKLKRCGLADKAKKLIKILQHDPYKNPPPYKKLVGDLSNESKIISRFCLLFPSLAALPIGLHRVYASPIRALTSTKIPAQNREIIFDSLLNGAYSRRINLQHRLVYMVYPQKMSVKVLRLWTHYE